MRGRSLDCGITAQEVAAQGHVQIFGNDIHPGALGLAIDACEEAMVAPLVELSVNDVADHTAPCTPSIVVTNPPWDLRLQVLSLSLRPCIWGWTPCLPSARGDRCCTTVGALMCIRMQIRASSRGKVWWGGGGGSYCFMAYTLWLTQVASGPGIHRPRRCSCKTNLR